MFDYMLVHLGSAMLSLLVLIIIVFAFMHLIPGNPAIVMLGPQADTSAIETLMKALELDKPLHIQFAKWFSNAIRGDLGHSICYGKPVLWLIINRAETSVFLAFFSSLMVLGIGIPAGIISSVKPNSWIDQLVFGGALLAAAIPTFWLGLNLMLVFGVILKWLPSCGFPSVVRSGNIANLRYLVLPSFSLAIPNAALLARITRSSMLDVLFRDYIVTATAKGLSQFKVVMKHALRTASIPIVTTAGFTFATLLSGTVVTETVFGLPGVGRLIVEAVQSRDYPVIQGILLVVAISYVFINFTTDIAYGFLDPRVRYV